jgi:hypothetical protein
MTDQILKLPSTHTFRPWYFRLYPKNSIGLLETGCFGLRAAPWRLADLTLTPTRTLLVQCWTGPENFIKILSFFKSYSTFSQGQTYTLPSIYGWVKKFVPCLIPLTSIHLLRALCSWRIKTLWTGLLLAKLFEKNCNFIPSSLSLQL